MHPDIASLHSRMSEGGDWMSFRDEISRLHKEAQTQPEFVTLMEAFTNLIAVGPSAYDAVTWEKVAAAARGEYRLFLHAEAMEGQELASPIMLDLITRREVEAGRLDENSDHRQFAIAGVALGDRVNPKDNSRPGDWFFYGAAVAGIVLWLLDSDLGLKPFLLIPVGLIVGWFMNEGERRKAIQRQADDRRARGYDV